ncbi:acyl carrier protein [Streptomyces albus]
MRTVEELIELANTELGTALRPADAAVELAQLDGWDSVHLLRLVALLETALGRRVPVDRMLEARTLRELWAVAVHP